MTRARTKLRLTALSVATLALTGCGDRLPFSNAEEPVDTGPAPLVLEAAAQGYNIPDPTYSPPSNRGNIECFEIVNALSTGPIYEATRWGLGEWDDFTRTNDGVDPHGPEDAPLLAAYIVDFCQGTPVANVRDAVNVFLSSRPGSNASRFGGVDPPIFVPEPEAPDSILDQIFGET